MNSPGRPDRSLDDPRAVASEYLVECARELAVTIADQEVELVGALAEVREQVPGLRRGPGSGGLAVIPRMCTRRVSISITKKILWNAPSSQSTESVLRGNPRR
jgi:hypothetical protein